MLAPPWGGACSGEVTGPPTRAVQAPPPLLNLTVQRNLPCKPTRWGGANVYISALPQPTGGWKSQTNSSRLATLLDSHRLADLRSQVCLNAHAVGTQVVGEVFGGHVQRVQQVRRGRHIWLPPPA